MLEKRLTEATSVFPQTFYHEMHVMKLPASQTLMEALRPKENAQIIVFEHSYAKHDFFTSQLAMGNWRVVQATNTTVYSHWVGRQFKNKQEQVILCYTERG